MIPVATQLALPPGHVSSRGDDVETLQPSENFGRLQVELWHRSMMMPKVDLGASDLFA